MELYREVLEMCRPEQVQYKLKELPKNETRENKRGAIFAEIMAKNNFTKNMNQHIQEEK